MDLERFQSCAQAYGAERRRWPAPMQPLFDRFAPTPEGQAILAEAEGLDQMLAAWTPSGDSDRVKHAVLAQAPRAPATGRSRRLIAALVLMLAVGFGVGFAQTRNTGTPDAVTHLIFGPIGPGGIGL